MCTISAALRLSQACGRVPLLPGREGGPSPWAASPASPPHTQHYWLWFGGTPDRRPPLSPLLAAQHLQVLPPLTDLAGNPGASRFPPCLSGALALVSRGLRLMVSGLPAVTPPHLCPPSHMILRNRFCCSHLLEPRPGARGGPRGTPPIPVLTVSQLPQDSEAPFFLKHMARTKHILSTPFRVLLKSK